MFYNKATAYEMMKLVLSLNTNKRRSWIKLILWTSLYCNGRTHNSIKMAILCSEFNKAVFLCYDTGLIWLVNATGTTIWLLVAFPLITNRAARHVQRFVIPFKGLSSTLSRSLALVTLSEAVLNQVLSKGICGQICRPWYERPNPWCRVRDQALARSNARTCRRT